MIEIDDVNSLLYEAHSLGGVVLGMRKLPCSICNAYFQANPNTDNIPRLMFPDIHFHGSEFNACERKVYLNYINGGSLSFSDSVFLNDGHLHEHSMLTNIENGLPYGWKIDKFENNSEQIKTVMNYKLVTHMDGMVIGQDGEAYGLECKSVKDKNFSKYADGWIDPIWYGQVQSYMFVNSIDAFYTIVKNRDNSKIHIPIKVSKDMNMIAKRLNVLRDVALSIEAYKKGDNVRQPDRMYENPKNDNCKWCVFKESCWID